MNFLSREFTLLRLQHGSGVLIHAPLDAGDDEGVDFSRPVPRPLTDPMAMEGQPDVVLVPAADGRTVHIARGQQDLWADSRSSMATFRDNTQERSEFLLIDDDELAHLRDILSHSWVRGRNAEGLEITLLPSPPFQLDLGLARIDLRARLPQPVPDGTGYSLETQVGEITITRAGPPRVQSVLQKRADMFRPPFTADVAAWRRSENSWLEIEGGEEYGSVPITVCDADRDWMYQRPLGGHDQTTGRHRCRPIVAHETGKWVLLTRTAEGIIIDEHGVCNEDGYLEVFGYRGAEPRTPTPAGMRLDHGRLFVEPAILADAPLVGGHTIVFLMSHLSNYAHWLIDNLLALHILLEFAPADARILLPGTLQTLRHAERRVLDHYDALRVFGFSHVPTIEIAQPWCRVEHAYWLQVGAVFNMPGEYLRAFRARVVAPRPPPARRDGRIYFARRHTRQIVNADVLMPFLERQGFVTHYIEDYSIDQQIDMFAQADWVIGPHGAEMGNLLFCHPGTKVLELAPECEYKPYFAYMCTKLGLTHGVLPCRTTDNGFNGNIFIDMQKFAGLFRMLKNRL